MKVAEIMTNEIHLLRTTDSLCYASELFLNQHIDGAPVVDDEGKLVGLLGKTHLYRAIANQKVLNASVSEFMEKNVRTIAMDCPIADLEKLSYGRLPVLNQGKMVGMLTKSDVSGALFQMLNDVNQELKAVIDSAHNAIISIDADGFIKIFNSPAERLFEMKKEDVMGCLFTDVLPQGKLMDILKSGHSQASQRFIYKNKTLVSNRSPVIVDGKIFGAIAVLQDISELESISNELHTTRELKEEVDAIIGSSFDGIYVTDGTGKTLMINEAYSRITGVKAPEIIGKTMQEMVDKGIIDRSATLLVIERREPVTVTQEIKNGKTLLATGNPIFDEEGELFRVVTNVRDITELNALKQEIEEVQRLSLHYKDQLRQLKVQGCERYVMKSQKSRDLLDLILRLGQVDSTVLIQGESGVGKEVIAEILYNNSLRKDKPFIRINCGAIPENLLESELFGYEAGAFTGAKKDGKIGLFEVADGGTLFLDEIGELPMYLQVKLLRVIQERELNRVGGTKPIKVDVRLIAATNRDLWDMVIQKQFRKDLFYRLNVVPVTVPPLRERKEEITAFINHFLEHFNKKYGFNKVLNENALKHLLEYNWPGNVRELENVIERAVVTTQNRIIGECDLLLGPGTSEESTELCFDSQLGLKEAVEKLEKTMIQKTLDAMGSTRKMAEALGVSQPTVVRKAARYGICLKGE
ncbi:MAG: sigma 54-interacting transcriptional regulator [Bacillota bacterium]|nr:sigma 54-interacting transcriptional regulator [Bacillota bacterium]